MDKNIIHSVLVNTATEQEAVEVAQWLGEAEGQLMVADMIDADMEKMVPHLGTRTHETRVHVINMVSRWWRVAAVVTMVVMVSIGATLVVPKVNQADVVMESVSAKRGEQVRVVLQDGTHIYLNAGSHLCFPSRFTAGNRKVTLVGEAYFEVMKNKHKPFMVELNGVSVEVLGTKFNVKAYDNESLQVNLDEGHVKFHGEKQEVDMQAGECLSYDRNTCLASVYRNVDTHMASAWKEHRLEVSEMPMMDLKNLLERKYDVTINVRDEQCYQYMYSLSASDHNLRTILKRMAYVSPILYHYDEEKGQVHIRARQ